MPGIRAAFGRHGTGAAVLAGYSLLAFVYLGLLPFVHGHGQSIGSGDDPQIFIWSFAWWPHAIAHGLNPFVSHAIWAPDGLNITWSTTVPGLALIFSPLTAIAGPVVSYDVAVVLMPALAALTAFLLCRYLTGALWPSLVGGYLFGFSSYLLAQDGYGGHLHLSSVFLVPLAALVILRFLDGKLGRPGLVVRLGPLLGLQLLFSTEVAFTLTLVLGSAIVLAFVTAPQRRAGLRRLLVPLAAAYALGGLLTAPFLYYALSAGIHGPFFDSNSFSADLVNFVIPTRLTLLGGSLFGSVSRRFPIFPVDQGAYLGLPTLLILGLYARGRRRTPEGRFLLAVLGLTFLIALGARATFAGRQFLTLPWRLLRSLPAFDNVLTNRFTAYVSLVSAVMVALWMAARRPGALRFVLPALAVIAIVPNPDGPMLRTTYHVPAFFTDKAYRQCLEPGETVLPLPLRSGVSLLWQVESGFRFNLAGGQIGSDIPESFFSPSSVLPIIGGQALDPSDAAGVRALVAEKHVTSIVVDGSEAGQFVPALDQVARPHVVGGVVFYQLTGHPPACPGA